jgi:hypothetical protein
VEAVKGGENVSEVFLLSVLMLFQELAALLRNVHAEDG